MAGFEEAYSILLQGDPDIWEGFTWKDQIILVVSEGTGFNYLLNAPAMPAGFSLPCGKEERAVSLAVSNLPLAELFEINPESAEVFYNIPELGTVYIQKVEPEDLENPYMPQIGLAAHRTFHSFQKKVFKNCPEAEAGRHYFGKTESDFDSIPYMLALASLSVKYFESGDPPTKIRLLESTLSLLSQFEKKFPEKAAASENDERIESSASYVSTQTLLKLGAMDESEAKERRSVICYSYTDCHFSHLIYGGLEETLPDWRRRLADGATLPDLLKEIGINPSSGQSEQDPAELIKGGKFEEVFEWAMKRKKYVAGIWGLFDAKMANQLRVSIHSDEAINFNLTLHSPQVVAGESWALIDADIDYESDWLALNISHGFFLLDGGPNIFKCNLAGFSPDSLELEGDGLKRLLENGGREYIEGAIRFRWEGNLQPAFTEERWKNQEPMAENLQASEDSAFSMRFKAMTEIKKTEFGALELDLWPDE